MSNEHEPGPSQDRGRTRHSLPPSQPDPPPQPRPPSDTIGTYLTAIAKALTEALRMFQYADKRLWEENGDEYEQIQELEMTLVEAKRDFIEMGKLVGGGLYYESDRRIDTLRELHDLSDRFAAHTETFKDWLRTGGPINPVWIKDTISLRKDLHRAQCRAARRIYVSDQEATSSSDAVRCLGAVIVTRALRRVREEQDHQPAWQQQQPPTDDVVPSPKGKGRGRRGSLESIIPVCNSIGHFERLGEADLAFVCDFCDGFLVWPNLHALPTERKYPGPLTAEGYPSWAASGRNHGGGRGEGCGFCAISDCESFAAQKGEVDG